MKYGTSIQKKNTTKKKDKKRKVSPISLILLVIILELFLYSIFSLTSHVNILFIGLTALLTIFFIIHSLKKKKIDTEDIIYFLIIIGILIRTLYIIKTPIEIRQHDIDTSHGHIQYIQYLFQNNKLPDTNINQFYQPPLHHFLTTIWLRIITSFGINIKKGLEGMQILTLFFSVLTIIYSKKIIDKTKIKNIFKIIIMSFMIFHPTFIILSGSINNDCLVVLLMIATTYYLIKWYEDSSINNLIILALTTGLSVMTKSNGALMSIPIIYVFLKKYIENSKKKKFNANYIKQFLLFGLVSLPIGLWFQIRQFIIFGSYKVPVLKAENLSTNYSIIERFLSIDINSIIKSPFCISVNYNIYEHNIYTYIFKNSIFGEFSYNFNKIFAYSFLIINILLIIISLLYLINYLKDKNKNIIYNTLLIIWIIHLISYIIFNIQYPYASTMDFRYIVPTLLGGIIIPAYELQNSKKWIKYICLSLSVLFILLSVCFVLFI